MIGEVRHGRLPKNRSVRNMARIAAKYGYRTEILNCGGGRAFLSLGNNFLRSPYPRHMTSNVVSAAYLEKVWDRMCDGEEL